MDKSPEAFRTISEVSAWLDTPPHVLRFWETRFSQLKPVKRAGGRRYYRPADVALLAGIRRLLHEDGLTIRGVQKILREKGVRHVAALGGLAAAGPAEPAPAPPGEGTAPEAPMAADVRPAGATVVPLRPAEGAAPEAGDPADPWWAATPAMALRALRARGGPARPEARARLRALALRAAALKARLEAARGGGPRG